jgi:hypothetical protein
MKIVMIGGLGNQLFQLAYGHITSTKPKSLKIYSDIHAHLDKPYDVYPFISKCIHSKEMKFNASIRVDYKIRLIRKVVYKKLNILTLILQKLLKVNYELEPFHYTEKVLVKQNSKKVSYGYFQHWKYVEMVWGTFGMEIENALKNVTLPKSLSEFASKSLVIHVRQGDYVDLKSTFGVLASSYYENLLKVYASQFVGRSIIVVTDDIEGARKTLSNVNVGVFYGPKELGSWETLKLMSVAPMLVTANSTLSWWGAFIASKAGAEVYMPNPWYKDLYDWPRDAYYFPQAHLVQSDFI